MARVREVRLTWDRSSGRYRKATTTGSTETYLRGPIPFDWLAAAAHLPGRALAVGVALWHLAGLRRTHQHLSLSSERLVVFGVSRHAKDRALHSLLDAGLVTVDRKKGRSPRVSLVTAPGKASRSRRGSTSVSG